MDKRELLIRTAFRLFYSHGIHAVGINSVLKESGVAKRTLYHHFESKEQLVEAVIQYRDAVFLEWMQKRLASVEAGEAGIRELFAALHDWFNDQVIELQAFNGCFFINSSAEYGDHDSPIHKACALHKEKVVQLIHRQVEASGVLAKKVDEVTGFIAMIKEGAIVTAHVQGDRDSALRGERLALAMLQLNRGHEPTA
ncbi:TetR family transcriptional regulator [Marinobacterium zhoushanense]|uniref:TetR family transcriptional regulator n=1 Tax=Marinobacterium zhoushanense TaxID=1679163 RepID=A0ABQ1K603_9GAMM|nr:TetR/AcrR family transcriptional regulator [Marinobacterium zhoushanense]GGB85465.1 TetR family transcriptional regulator [Marinobacterium zhoushanense]